MNNLTDTEKIVLRVALEQYLSQLREQQYGGDPDALIESGTEVTYREAEEVTQDLLERAR